MLNDTYPAEASHRHTPRHSASALSPRAQLPPCTITMAARGGSDAGFASAGRQTSSIRGWPATDPYWRSAVTVESDVVARSGSTTAIFAWSWVESIPDVAHPAVAVITASAPISAIGER